MPFTHPMVMMVMTAKWRLGRNDVYLVGSIAIMMHAPTIAYAIHMPVPKKKNILQAHSHAQMRLA